MKFQKIITNIFKQDPITKQLKDCNLYQNSLKAQFFSKSWKMYHQHLKNNQEEELIKNLLKIIDEKPGSQRKLKALTLWIQIFKESKYDLSDILINKKIKLFTKTNTQKHEFPTVNKNNLQQFVLHQLLIPLYNYFMKLSLNQDLYKYCRIGKIPQDDIFRRGTKIRFIWIFKIYNLIYSLIPILKACVMVMQKFDDFAGLLQIACVLYNDLITMNSFVIEALEEGSQDNFMLMPYFDMLQFYESLTQQNKIMIKINSIYSGLLPYQSLQLQKPRMLKIDKQTQQQIQTQAVRVKLISCTLKNPKKDHTRLITQYQQQLVKQKSRLLKTEAGDQDINNSQPITGYGKNFSNRKGNKNAEDFNVKYKLMDEI